MYILVCRGGSLARGALLFDASPRPGKEPLSLQGPLPQDASPGGHSLRLVRQLGQGRMGALGARKAVLSPGGNCLQNPKTETVFWPISYSIFLISFSSSLPCHFKTELEKTQKTVSVLKVLLFLKENFR